MKQEIKSKTLERLKQVEHMTEETIGIAAATNLKCYENGKTLERITDNVNEINGKLNKSEDTAKYITSFWYRMKKRAMRLVGFEGQPTQEKHQSKSAPPVRQQYSINQSIQAAHQISSEEGQETIDKILQNLKILKKHGKDLGQEIDRQAPIIDNLSTEMDKASNKMQKVNKILKKELK